MVRVCIDWWTGQSGEDTRWNEKGFKNAGCDISSSEYADLIFTPVPGREVKRGTLWTQLGGYGANVILPNSKPQID